MGWSDKRQRIWEQVAAVEELEEDEGESIAEIVFEEFVIDYDVWVNLWVYNNIQK